jgi:predicted alpha-1,2-mannosidase
LIFDNIDGHARGLRLDLDRGRLSAVSGGNTETGRGRMFITASFDQPVRAGGSLQGERGGMGYLAFDTSGSRTVTMKIATSRISLAQAEHNLALEIGDQDFDAVRDQAQAVWDETLGVISDVEGATPEQLTTLYSSLYRMSLYQNSMFENVGTAEQPDYQHAVLAPSADRSAGHLDHGFDAVAATRPGTMRSSTVFWDTYRTTWPALSLFYPTKTGQLLDGIVTSYRESGWLGRGMVGSSSDVTLADAYLRGVRGFDVQGAYESAIKNATVASQDRRLGRPGLTRSIFLGYNALSEPISGSDEGTAEALENYLNDFGIAQLSKALHDQTGEQRYLDQHRYFSSRALGYIHLFDPATGFFQGRTADGRWRHTPETYDPKVWGYDYTETNGWGMAFAVPHDGRGLANLYGGPAGLADKLDQFFSTSERMDDFGSYGGIIHEQREAANVQLGQWGQSNQPAFHIPHLYNCAGQPYKAQAILREALARLFVGGDIGQGYPGDEDTGSMSAWYVLNALGLYPLRVGTPAFVIGSPLFRSATINLETGNKVTIKAPNNGPDNVFVQGLRVNGAPYDRTEIAQSILTDGATLEFDLGPEPSDWGTDPASAPESLTADDRPPNPMGDLTLPGMGVAIGPDGQTADALFDNTSDTELIFGSAEAEVTWQFGDRGRTAQLYTLTSADTPGGDPTTWELLGSADGQHWVSLDRRTDERFVWRRQTRVFSIPEPGDYQHYRLAVSATDATQPLALAEIELLGHPAP